MKKISLEKTYYLGVLHFDCIFRDKVTLEFDGKKIKANVERVIGEFKQKTIKFECDFSKFARTRFYYGESTEEVWKDLVQDCINNFPKNNSTFNPFVDSIKLSLDDEEKQTNTDNKQTAYLEELFYFMKIPNAVMEILAGTKYVKKIN